LSILAHLAEKCKYYFHFLRKIFQKSTCRNMRSRIPARRFYSPGLILTTLPRFHRRAAMRSASCICISVSYSI